jgi:hypothetical protein
MPRRCREVLREAGFECMDDQLDIISPQRSTTIEAGHDQIDDPRAVSIQSSYTENLVRNKRACYWVEAWTASQKSAKSYSWPRRLTTIISTHQPMFHLYTHVAERFVIFVVKMLSNRVWLGALSQVLAMTRYADSETQS